MEDTHNAAESKQRTIGELIATLSEQISSLIHDEIQLIQQNIKAKFTKIGAGGVVLAIAVLLLLLVIPLLVLAAVAGFAEIMPWWAAFLVVSGILLLIVLGLVFTAALLIKASNKHAIDPKGAIIRDIDAVKKGFKNE